MEIIQLWYHDTIIIIITASSTTTRGNTIISNINTKRQK